MAKKHQQQQPPTNQPIIGDEIGLPSPEDEKILNRIQSRFTKADIERSKQRLRAIQRAQAKTPPIIDDTPPALLPAPSQQQREESTPMAVTNKPWDGSESRFSIEEWKRSTLIDTGEGDPNTKARYKLPVREPDGTLNANAVRNALARINQVDAPADAKKRALTKLQALKKQAGIGQDRD